MDSSPLRAIHILLYGGDIMHIQPETVVELYKGIECDANYENTYWFNSVSEQNSFFTNKQHTTFQHLTFQRLYKNVVRINAHLGDVYNVNYMRFQNPTFGGKWFYAFVLKCDYVNAETVDVYYKIDDMQTWFPYIDKSEKQYMLRMHDIHDYMCTDSNHRNDVNTEDEPVDCSDTMILSSTKLESLTTNFKLILGHMKNGLTPADTIETGSFNCCKFEVYNFDFAGIQQLLDQVNSYVANDSVSSIIGCWIVPAVLYTADYHEEYYYTPDASFGTYVPKNKKLFTYPYTYMIVDSGSDKKEYRFENFENSSSNNSSFIGRFQFNMIGKVTLKPEAFMFPENYESWNAAGQAVNRDYACKGVMLTDFPIVALPIDSIMATIAQLNATQYTTAWDIGKNVSNVLGSIAGVGTGTPDTKEGIDGTRIPTGTSSSTPSIPGISQLFQAITGLMDTAVNKMQSVNNGLRKSGEMFGVSANNGVLFYSGNKSFHFYQIGLSPRSAKRIDDFFSKYGYAQNKSFPLTDVTHRSAFCYVQTQNANLSGNVPADSLNEIENALNKGIWFWHDKNHVGQYDITNNIV